MIFSCSHPVKVPPFVFVKMFTLKIITPNYSVDILNNFVDILFKDLANVTALELANQMTWKASSEMVVNSFRA